MRIELALKDIIENRLSMNYFSEHAMGAYADIGGCFTGKNSVEEFELAYMRRVFS